MALYAARGLGMLGRRFFPAAMRSMASSYRANPALWHRGLNYARSAAAGAATVGPALYNLRSHKRARADTGAVGRQSTYSAPSKGKAKEVTTNAYAGNPGYAGRFPRRKKRKFSRGKWSGRFRKRKMVKPTMGKCIKYGATQTTEINGRVSDPNCVYLGHAAVSEDNVMSLIARCLVGKLFKIAGYTITNWSDTITTMTGGASDIRITLQQDDRVNVNSAAFSSATATPLQIAATLETWLETWAAQDSAGQAVNSQNLKQLILQFPDVPGTIDNNIRANIRLDEYMVNIVSVSEMKVQNRSASYTGSSSADDVAVNPLEGKLIDFAQGPKTVIDYMYPLQLFEYATGIMLRRAAEFNAKAYAKEPPSGRIFSNTKKTDKVYLQPGQIKSGVIYYTKKKNLLSYLLELNCRYDNNNKVVQLNCPSQVIALEDCINVNAAQLIECAYEVNRKTGVFLTKNKKFARVNVFDSTTFDNLTPP